MEKDFVCQSNFACAAITEARQSDKAPP